jgi:hypothetical protein
MRFVPFATVNEDLPRNANVLAPSYRRKTAAKIELTGL